MPFPIEVTWTHVSLGFFSLSFNVSSLFYTFYSLEFSYKVGTSIDLPLTF